MIGGAFLLILLLYAPVFADSRSPRGISGWAWSELHINYAGGFVRRGLLGETAFRLHASSGLSTGAFFSTLFFTGTLLLLGLLFRLAWPLRLHPALLYVVVLSPAFVLFPVYEARAASMRKELFVCIGLAAHAVIVQAVRHRSITGDGYRRALALIVAPYLAIVTLIHELQWFFLPLHVWLLAAGLPGRWRSTAAAALLPVFILGGVVMAHPGDSGAADAICESWAGRVEVRCDDGAIGAIGWSLADTMALSAEIATSPRSLMVWILCAALAAVPLLALSFSLRESRDRPHRSLLGLVLVMLPVLLLFVLGRDWGRWLYLITMGGVTAMLAAAPARVAPAAGQSGWARALVAVGLVLYLGAWSLPHAGAQTTVSPGFPSAAERGARLQVRLLAKIVPLLGVSTK